MKRALIILAIVIGILILILGVLYFSLNGKQTTGEKISIIGKNSVEISVDNFKKTSNNYGSVSSLPSGDNFYIQYDEANHAFSITFSVSSIQEGVTARTVAESKLLNQLGVSKGDACNLIVTEDFFQADQVGLPTGQFPMSFCPGGDVFPSTNNINQIR